MIKNIYLDIDGCIANFEKKACELLNLDVNDVNIRKLLKDDSPDSLGEYVGKGRFWSSIHKAGESFWSDLELYPWSKQMYADLKAIAIGDVYFLTSPSSDPWSVSGKMKAITKHFKTRNFLIGAPKHCCARPDALLIDDAPKKINKFKETGGNIYLFPRAYKIIDGEISYESIIEEVKGIICQSVSNL